jgi:hypothetical protein
MHYAECWARERGPASLVIFTANAHILSDLCKFICPSVYIISFANISSKLITLIFKKGLYQYFTLNPIYAYACCRWPHALYLSDTPFSLMQKDNVSCYVASMDPLLDGLLPFSEDFVRTYLEAREVHDHRRSNFQDMVKLHYQHTRKKPLHPKEDESDRLLDDLKIQSPYVVLNLNCKRYADPLRNNRSIQHPERFNTLIDYLIANGFTVVAQGRNEQPRLKPRAGHIEYFNSKYDYLQYPSLWSEFHRIE